MRRALLLLLGSALIALASGCATKTPEDSTIPWSRPAAWEGGMPGMPGMGSGRGGM